MAHLSANSLPLMEQENSGLSLIVQAYNSVCGSVGRDSAVTSVLSRSRSHDIPASPSTIQSHEDKDSLYTFSSTTRTLVDADPSSTHGSSRQAIERDRYESTRRSPSSHGRAPLRAPHYVEQREVPGEKLCHVLKDGTHSHAFINDEPVSRSRGINKGSVSRRRSTQACLTCQKKKIKCDQEFPRCDECTQSRRVCIRDATQPNVESRHFTEREILLAAERLTKDSAISYSKDPLPPPSLEIFSERLDELNVKQRHFDRSAIKREDLDILQEDLEILRGRDETKQIRIRQLEDIMLKLFEQIRTIGTKYEVNARRLECVIRTSPQDQKLQKEIDVKLQHLESTEMHSHHNRGLSAERAHANGSPCPSLSNSVGTHEDSASSSYCSSRASEESNIETTQTTTPQPPSSGTSPNVSSQSEDMPSSLRALCLRAISKAFIVVLYSKCIPRHSSGVPGIHACTQRSEESGSQPPTQPNESFSSSDDQSGKRQRSSNVDIPKDDDGRNSDDDENEHPKKKGKKVARDASQARRRLKCPYYQRRPEEHTRAACRGEGFTDMAKLKDHLKRVHTRPLQCMRCWESMTSNTERDCHLQQDPICVKIAEPLDDRMPAQRLQELNFNAGPFGQAKTIEEKWRILFRILFPAEELVPSPYEISGMSMQFERLFTKILEEELSKELGPALSRIEGRLCGIIQRCKELADQASRANPPNESPTRNPSSVPKGDTAMPLLTTSENPSDEMAVEELTQWSNEDWANIFDASYHEFGEGFTSSKDCEGVFLSPFRYRSLTDFGFPRS